MISLPHVPTDDPRHSMPMPNPQKKAAPQRAPPPQHQAYSNGPSMQARSNGVSAMLLPQKTPIQQAVWRSDGLQNHQQHTHMQEQHHLQSQQAQRQTAMRQPALRQAPNAPAAQQQRQQHLPNGMGFASSAGQVPPPQSAAGSPQPPGPHWNAPGMMPMQSGAYSSQGQPRQSMAGTGYNQHQTQQQQQHQLQFSSQHHGYAQQAPQGQQVLQGQARHELEQRQLQHQQQLQQHRMMMSMQGHQPQSQHMLQQQQQQQHFVSSQMSMGPGNHIHLHRPSQRLPLPTGSRALPSDYASIMVPTGSDNEAAAQRKYTGASAILDTKMQPPMKRLGQLQHVYHTMPVGGRPEDCPPFSL